MDDPGFRKAIEATGRKKYPHDRPLDGSLHHLAHH